jgi:hypothetical protein
MEVSAGRAAGRTQAANQVATLDVIALMNLEA